MESGAIGELRSRKRQQTLRLIEANDLTKQIMEAAERGDMVAAQMLLGAAKLALESGEHPGALKDAVCSPGGTTIQGVRALERGGMRGAVMEAVIAAYEKNRSIG